MKRNRTEDQDHVLVDRLLFSPNRIRAEPFPSELMTRGKTPDRVLFRDGLAFAHYELKSLHDERPPGLRPDPLYGKRTPTGKFIPGKLERHIAKAAAQFDAVDADHAIPRLLVFLSSDGASADYGDLRAAISGNYQTPDGRTFPFLGDLADRLRTDVGQIDLIAWIDICTDRLQGYMENRGSPTHVATLLSALQPESIS